MGIQGLWNVLGDGEIIHIADFATRHYKQHKRPLRVAVDEACWRFTNLNAEQVEHIRNGEPAANPVEKTVLWRILRLLKLNVQLLFVFDGLRKPGKDRHGGRGGGRVDKELTKLMRQMLDHLKIPHHQAPGEAEAECAALQKAGIVDAVWADDGDALMFGCTTLIKAHKTKGERVKDYIKVYTADYLLEKHDFDSASLVLFALLAGGDYNTKGVPGCGPETARVICRRENLIANSTCMIEQQDVLRWRMQLENVFRQCVKPVALPPDFPSFKVLNGYRRPAVSSEEQMHDLRGLRRGWEPSLDQNKLRPFLRQRFNFRTREFIKHIAPICLARILARVSPEHKDKNLQFGVQKKRTRKVTSSADTESSAKLEVKITFSPLPALEIDLARPPDDEDWSIWDGKDGTKYDPHENIECEIMSCFLENGLPADSFDAPVATSKSKRKAVDEEFDVGSSDKIKKARIPSKSVPKTSSRGDGGSYSSPASCQGQPTSRLPSAARESVAAQPTSRKNVVAPTSPPFVKPKFRLLNVPESLDLTIAKALSAQRDALPEIIPITHKSHDRSAFGLTSAQRGVSSSSRPPMILPGTPSQPYEIIDLT